MTDLFTRFLVIPACAIPAYVKVDHFRSRIFPYPPLFPMIFSSRILITSCLSSWLSPSPSRSPMTRSTACPCKCRLLVAPPTASLYVGCLNPRLILISRCPTLSSAIPQAIQGICTRDACRSANTVHDLRMDQYNSCSNNHQKAENLLPERYLPGT